MPTCPDRPRGCLVQKHMACRRMWRRWPPIGCTYLCPGSPKASTSRPPPRSACTKAHARTEATDALPGSERYQSDNAGCRTRSQRLAMTNLLEVRGIELRYLL